MSIVTEELQDVMQVCCNGHVVTDLLRTYPEQGRTHCDRCGASTLDHCRTCGQELPGAIPVPGMVPVGQRTPPHFCPRCGAPFPWAKAGRGTPPPNALTTVETLLRRLPRSIRQLRSRHGERPAFRVDDVYDLEDLVRALLPLHFDDVRPLLRTPRYATANRTDFQLAPERLVVIVKCVTAAGQEKAIGEQWQEDVANYQEQPEGRRVAMFVYDPLGSLSGPRQLETGWSHKEGDREVRCIIDG